MKSWEDWTTADDNGYYYRIRYRYKYREGITTAYRHRIRSGTEEEEHYDKSEGKE